MSKKKNDINEIDSVSSELSETAEKAPRNLKKLRFGSVSVLVLLLVLAIIIAANVMANLLAKRTPLKLDLTPDNRYELSDESIQAMKDLTEDVDITVTSTRETFTSMASYFKQMYASYYGMNVEMPYEMIPEILDKYSVYAQSGKGSVNVKFVDINKDPDVLTEIKKNYNGDIAEGSIVVTCGDRVKVIGTEDVRNMITPSNGSTQANMSMVFAGESILTTSILSVVDSNPVSAGIITTINGAGVYESGYESIVTGLRDLLTKNGYNVSDVDIATGNITPDEYQLLVIPVPSMDFTSDVIDKLGDFLYNGGQYGRNLLYIPSFSTTNLPNINEFLADWSIEISEEDMVMDENTVQTPVYALNSIAQTPVLTVADADSVGKLANEALPIVAPFPKEIKILSKNNGTIVTAVLKTSDTSYPVVAGEEKKDEKGARSVAVVSRKETSDQFAVLSSHVMVLGSAFMTDNLIIGQNTTYNNASVILGMINNMTGKENGIVIPEKALQQNVIAPTAGEARVIRILIIYLIPALVAAVGIFVLLRRRNR